MQLIQQPTIAVLITCYNRKNKTIDCLINLHSQEKIKSSFIIDVYVVDDGSTDYTSDEISLLFPEVKIINGNGNLFWAGGMRLAWETARLAGEYDFFLLLNDDVKLEKDIILKLLKLDDYAVKTKGRRGAYIGATVDEVTNKVTYGGHSFLRKYPIIKTRLHNISAEIVECHFANANILMVSKDVVDKIGILDNNFTHGIADYDYTLNILRNGFPILISPGVGGYCSDDHGNNWKPINVTLKKRIDFLMSPKGLAYKEYLFYVRRHFPWYYPYSFIMLWLKTFFPVLWENYKNK